MKHTEQSTRLWKRAMVLALTVICLAGMFPWPAATGLAEGEIYGQVTDDNVKVRKSASTSADWWFKLPKDWVSQIVGTTTSGGVTWYKVNTNGPTQGDRTYVGYIHGDFFRQLTAEEQAAWLVSKPQPGIGVVTPTPAPTPEGETPTVAPGSATPIPEPSNYGRINKGGVNFREKANGPVIGRLDNGTVVELLEIPAYLTKAYWFKVKYNGDTGYIQADLITILTKAEAEYYQNQTPPASESDAVYGYIRLTDEGINLRQTPGGKIVARIDGKPVLAYLASPVQKSGVTWYYVKSQNKYGYVHGDFATLADSAGNTVAPVATATPDPSATATLAPEATATPAQGAAYGYIQLTDEGINLRDAPAGKILTRIDGKPVMAYLKEPVTKSGITWYYVKFQNRYGYVHGNYAKVVDEAGNTLPPSSTTTPPPVAAQGYVQVTKPSVNLRKSIAGAVISTVDKDTVWPMVSGSIKSGSYTWFPVDVNGLRGFLRSDVAYQMSAAQVEAYLNGQGIPTPTPAPTATPGPSQYAITIVDKVNLRASASKDARSPYNVALGTVFPYTTTTTVSGSKWYKITYMDSPLWVLGSCVKVMNTQEYQDWVNGQPTPTPTAAPTDTPKPEDLSDMAETNTDNVFVRVSGSASAKQVTKIYKKGTIVTWVDGVTVQSDGYTWYSVKLQSSATGYIRGDLLRIYTKTEKEEYEKINNPGSGGNGGQQEASYETLRKGSTGDAVKALQTKLKEKGFFSGTISGTYGTDTVDAVKAFQKSKGLTVDGVAGPATQHTLYGTVPVGTGDIEYVYDPPYSVEKIDWWTGGIQTQFPRGKTVKIVDVKTHIAFWVKRWAGGNHADVEPLTAGDTAAMCKIYGVSNAQQIATKDLWERRPLWVIVGNKVYAASMYGEPHNYPEGDTIPNNNFNGQFCIHFTNSKTHTGNRVDPLHTAAIQAAYDAGHK